MAGVTQPLVMSCSSGGGGSGGGNSNGNCNVIQHFRENFELSGFGSPGEALVVSSSAACSSSTTWLKTGVLSRMGMNLQIAEVGVQFADSKVRDSLFSLSCTLVCGGAVNS